MYIVIGIIIASVALGLFLSKKSMDDAAVTVFTTGIVVSFVSIPVLFIVGESLPKKDVPQQYIEIASLKDNQNISGSFFLGSGTIKEKPVYYYLEKIKGGYRQATIKADNAILYETDKYEPHIIIKSTEFTEDWMYGVAINVPEKSSEIYIPKNSIVADYKVDNE